MLVNKINTQKTQIVISDIHGQYQTLLRLKEQIKYDESKHQMIYLGDYIDRGPQSWEVVELIQREVKEEEAIALMGNHEKMFLDALRFGKDKKQLWFYNGGYYSLLKFMELRSDSTRKQIIEFLSGLPLYIESENYLFVHAGIDPTKTLDEQTDDDLLWIREEFLYARDLKKVTDKIVIFGHTPTWYFTGKKEVYFKDDRIGIDTGAGQGYYLSALILKTHEVHKTKVSNI
ncbi:MAG TPA: serine/threonine protein phosphatase [Peptococcaceae bacterium]|nr:serine/threonine protein phosphatase [Peptococcaceae bacterium]